MQERAERNAGHMRGKRFVTVLMVCVVALSPWVGAGASEPDAGTLDAAINAAGFADYHRDLTVWLDAKVPAGAGGVSASALKALLEEPAFAKVLARRQFLSKVGVEEMGAFARGSRAHRAFLAWLLHHTEPVTLCLEGATPVQTDRRKQGDWRIPASSLAIWAGLYHADPESRSGVCLELAIATGLNPPGTGNQGAGQAEAAAEPLDRYNHFKAAYRNGELFPSFATHSVWEYRQIVSSNASNADLVWARKMINTWRPDLRADEQVVKSTSEVQYRNSPIPYGHTFKNVLTGGGKCGPRSSWAVFICQAFGIPVVGVRQPGHVCAAYKAPRLELGPQPGNRWKVVYGGGWPRSRVAGMPGPEFLQEMKMRLHEKPFWQGEHLRWLAAALTSDEQADAVRELADRIQQAAVDAEPQRAPLPVSKPKPEEPLPVAPGVVHVEAEAFSNMSGGTVHDCFTGGKQAYFPSIGTNWGKDPSADYAVDVPETGVYALVLRIATPRRQTMEVYTGGGRAGDVEVPNTHGLWGTTPDADLVLQEGKQTLTLRPARPHRGLAIRWLELRRKPPPP